MNEQTPSAIEKTRNPFTKMNIDNNVIIIAGYAIFFSAWNFAAPVPATILMLLSGFLMILSGIFFVAYKVYRIIVHTFYFRRLAKDLENNRVDPDKKIEAYKNAEIAFAAQSMKAGSWFLVPSILSAMSGTSIFIYQLFIGFFSHR
ncbi:MAG: hypothetical protein A4E57_01795 [Syntrophorhabdaceae bacterium PtaU1.Bin034]|nr:MAG: hypothetical protein A4E57_01795 [Syntrophorhabdaceae bacterium PtaU1.Bin034]